jgi:hypothetical protein
MKSEARVHRCLVPISGPIVVLPTARELSRTSLSEQGRQSQSRTEAYRSGTRITTITNVTICNRRRTRLPSEAGPVKKSGQEQLNVMIFRHQPTVCPQCVVGAAVVKPFIPPAECGSFYRYMALSPPPTPGNAMRRIPLIGGKQGVDGREQETALASCKYRLQTYAPGISGNTE